MARTPSSDLPLKPGCIRIRCVHITNALTDSRVCCLSMQATKLGMALSWLRKSCNKSVEPRVMLLMARMALSRTYIKSRKRGDHFVRKCDEARLKQRWEQASCVQACELESECDNKF
eukprot:TRINITY_DN11111_c0_g2_i1.p2 TRINITY_DN11111_c0_g2~~TRINITY_DN11111_c0_g2_i1.p2  ORF type:complete len:117 (-),score=6.46 TRINITY_DN11111_c0_g2_i1:702-1052(-)